MNQIQTKAIKKAYYSVDDQPNFKNRDSGKQKKVLFDLDGLPDSAEEIEEQWKDEDDKEG